MKSEAQLLREAQAVAGGRFLEARRAHERMAADPRTEADELDAQEDIVRDRIAVCEDFEVNCIALAEADDLRRLTAAAGREGGPAQ